MHSSVRFQHIGAVPFLPPFLSWSVSADGTMLSMTGPAAERFAAEVGRVVGIDYRAAFAGEPEAMRLVAQALSGGASEPLALETRAWGVKWINFVYPLDPRRGRMQVDGCSFPLPAEAEEADGTHTWFVRETVRIAGHEVPQGSALRFDGASYMAVTALPTAATVDAMRLNPSAFEYWLPAEPGDPALPAGASPQRGRAAGTPLRLIR